MMNIVKYMVATILLCAIITHAPPVFAQQTEIKVVYTDWFPYSFQQDGAAAGFEIDILKSVLESMGITAVFVNHPWKRCLYSLKTGGADALVSMLKTADRETYACYPDAHISLSNTVFITTTDRAIRFDGSYEALSGYSIGVISGFAYGYEFDRAKYLKIDPVTNADMLLKKLLANRNDIIAENQAVIYGLAKKMGVQNKIKTLSVPIHSQKLYVGFSKTNKLETLCFHFSAALETFKRSKEYRQILEKYGIHIDVSSR